MNNENELKEFINDPEVIDFNVTYNEEIKQLLKDNPKVKLGKVLGNYAIIHVAESEKDAFLGEDTWSRIHLFSNVLGLLSPSVLESTGISQVQNQPYLSIRGKDVLLGFIDTGIDYTDQEFLYEDETTRIEYLWDQTLEGKSPEGFHYGAEYTKKEINEALRTSNPRDIIPHHDTIGHGTFLASVSGSKDRTIGVAPDSEFIVVKLRKAKDFYIDRYLVPKEQKNVYSSSDVMVGIQYILEKAEELNKPVSICIALGTSFGSHDGFSMLESYINTISQRTGVCITYAVGNESQARHHTSGRLTIDNPEKSIGVKVASNSESFPVYLWNNPPGRFSITVISPTGERVGRIPAKNGTRYETKLVLEKAVVSIEYYYPMERTGRQLSIIKIKSPTPGVWRILVHGDNILTGQYHAWLPIDGFVSKGVEFVEADPNYTLVLPSTAIGGIAVGAYNNSNNSMYLNSSWGPTTLPLMSPDLVAPGVDILGGSSTKGRTMSGTGVASAITAGAAALMLEWGIVNKNDTVMNTYRIKAYFIRGCVRDPRLSYPNTEWGNGTLNLLRTFELLRET